VAEYGRKYRGTTDGIYGLIKGRQKYYHTHDMNKQKPLIISKDDFTEWYENEPKICVYCGIKEDELELVDDPFMNKYKRLTVDCKDNDLGYVNGNLVLCCRRCNTLKIDFFTYEEFKEIGKRFVAKRWKKYLSPRTKKCEICGKEYEPDPLLSTSSMWCAACHYQAKKDLK